jgi:hypothetical protein
VEIKKQIEEEERSVIEKDEPKDQEHKENIYENDIL